jgi:hypothetical protein
MAPYASGGGQPDFGSMSAGDIQNYLQAQRQQLAANGGEAGTFNTFSGSPSGSYDTGTQSSSGGGPNIVGSIPTLPFGQFGSGGSSGGGSGGGGAAVRFGGTSSNTSGTNAGILGGLNSSGVAPNSSPNLTQYGFPGANTPTFNAPGPTPGQLQPGSLQMQQANPQDAMDQYHNTLGYQMLGNDQTNQYQQSPGYQFAVNEAMRQLNQNASSRGLLDSGSALRAATNQAVGMAQQDYGNWWNRQNQLYSDYQNRLAGLAGGPTGSQDAMATGQGLATGSMQTGTNLGSLFGTQGFAGMGGIINTGAAQAGNMMNAGTQQAQINSANQSTQLAGATSLAPRSGIF